ncbi:MAG: A/G-specific adenine glycosylase [Planctomycetaceae bacterium]|nr:A/G-specific adenine glycosylase [Planctomycetaceae bacterium]
MERENIDFDANRLRRLRSGLTRWYARNARDLPWRRTGDAYAIWISEIMLQQTTVAAVIPYFERFLKSFPTIQRLGQAAEDEVLRHWEGLGYYSRARNIHKTARQLAAEEGGRFPESTEELVQLPGIGRYTAGAIASFAFDVRAPIVEANTLRLYSRLLGYDGDPRSTGGQRLMWEFAERILPRSHVGRFNQALMELGGTLCTPKEPGCDACPVRSCCAAFAQGRQAEIPVRARRPEVTAVTEACVAIRDAGEYLLLKRSEGQRWAGMWDFPRFELTGAEPIDANGDGWVLAARQRGEVSKTVAELVALDVDVKGVLTRIRHSVTRYRITLYCVEADLRSGSRGEDCDERRWFNPGEFSGVPLSVTGRKLAKQLLDLESRRSTDDGG